MATEHKGSDVKAVMTKSGDTQNFFGGKGKADGPGHSHINLNESGKETFRREGPNSKKK
jgi:hypothetical protein